jgi:hypothetical protein
MPGLNAAPPATNPFAGIRRAGQAKRAMNYAKYQSSQSATPDPSKIAFGDPNKAAFEGSKNQLMGGAMKSQFGSTKPPKF